MNRFWPKHTFLKETNFDFFNMLPNSWNLQTVFQKSCDVQNFFWRKLHISRSGKFPVKDMVPGWPRASAADVWTTVRAQWMDGGGAGSGEVDRAVGWALCWHKTVNTSRNCTTVKASTKLWTGHLSQLLHAPPALLHLSTMISPRGGGATFFANNIELCFWTSSCALV